MGSINAESGPVVWAVLRQVQAIRDALVWSLGGGAIKAPDKDRLGAWFSQQGFNISQEELTGGVHPLRLGGETEGQATKSNRPLITVIDHALEEYRRLRLGDDSRVLASLGQKSAQPLQDFGANRSGAGWDRADDFLITSAFVRLLGAHEQFELDVLKCLLYYRPSGELLGHEYDQEMQLIDETIPREVPKKRKKKFRYEKPPLWTWLKKSVENNAARHEVYSNVFNIKATPKTEAENYNKLREKWYEQRNAVAHGRASVTMSLTEYVDVEIYVFRSAMHIANECRTKFKLIV